MYYEDKKTNIEANSDFGILLAQYELLRGDGFINHQGSVLRSSNIKHSIKINRKEKLAGNFLLDLFIDYELPPKALCHISVEHCKDNERILKMNFFKWCSI